MARQAARRYVGYLPRTYTLALGQSSVHGLLRPGYAMRRRYERMLRWRHTAQAHERGRALDGMAGVRHT